MKFIYLGLLIAATTAYACGDNAYRCKNPKKIIAEEWKATHEICNNLREDDCYCSHWAEYYCDPYGGNIQKFKDQCEAKGSDWYWSECRQIPMTSSYQA
ncbi:uncharacterized protein EAF02_003116 [Botrytis sinoallii]|uniref:uncharacterized protein n=1 Tax=Botrytis sinoallii TaxID=1463999 RepID=UPI001900BD0D|nr:uncharacterized protein EAF02_003116 [Botrytis sinoallii]KAF7888575.1 hypothetical protein EAF02_003116 [Botrytis sinoallii]